MDRPVAPISPTIAMVINRCVTLAVPIGPARDSSGMATEVSTPPISSSKMMLGRVLAIV
ncbi:MAG: hypothetical protein U0R72_04490 [Nakamurella multipartita]